MRSIEPRLSPKVTAHVGNGSVDKAAPYEVRTYRELMSEVAQLAYLNKDSLLFFRGQGQDYKNRAGSSTFYPTIYRDDYLASREVQYRFEILLQATKLLVEVFEREKINGYQDVRRKRYIAWSILQHYEVCPTPLLDFTHSVRVACSFAQLKSSDEAAYVFVFALPYITNRISINSEHDLVNVRLLSICPPDALRPYYQDGYLAGTEDITTEYDSKTELDFKHRLVAKFKMPAGTRFWGKGFSRIPESVLYPSGDKIQKLCQDLNITLESDLRPGEIGEFLKQWATAEERLRHRVRKLEARNVSLREAIRLLERQGVLPKDVAYKLDYIRLFRNQLVHEPKSLDPGEIQVQLDRLEQILRRLGD